MSTANSIGTPHILARLAGVLFPGGFGPWYVASFLRGFCYYWPLLVLLFLPLGMMAGTLGAEFGPKFLFFHDDGLKQFVAGAAVAFYWAAVLFVAYLLSLRERRETNSPTPARKPPPQRFLPYSVAIVASLGITTLGCAAILVLCLASFRVLSDPITTSQSVAPEARAANRDPAALDPLEDLAESSAADPDTAKSGSSVGATLRLHFVYFGIGALTTWGIMGLAVRIFRRRRAHATRESRRGRFARWWIGLRRRLRRLTTPPLVGGSGTARRVCRWALGLPLALVWTVVLVYLVRGDATAGMRYAGALAFAVVGLGASILAVARPEWTRLFLAALAVNSVLAYAGVSYCLSSCPWGLLAAFIAALGCAIFVGAVVWTFFPKQWQHAQGTVLHRVLMLPTRERRALGIGLLYLVVIPIVLTVFGLTSFLASPVPLILLLLFGVIAVYGLVAYAVRRSMAVLLALVVLVACVSHVQPYRMRFPGLEKEPILDLHAQTQAEVNLQKDFDGLLEKYLNTALEAKAATQDREIRDAEREAQLTKEIQELEKNLKERWGKMEDGNRTRASRLLAATQEDWRVSKLNLKHGRSKGDGLLVARGDDADRDRDDDLKVWPKLPEENRPLVIIAVSGGGIRAAVWTFAVLKELELWFAGLDPPTDFPSHVRIIAGASGGIVGASYYVASLPHPDQRPLPDCRRRDLEEQQSWLASDFLTPLFQRGALSDFPCWLSPWPMRHDRGRALEEAWSYHLKRPGARPGPGEGVLDLTFDDLRPGEKDGWRPSLVISPMLVEDGRRLIISNLDMRYPISNDGSVLTQSPTAQAFENHSIEAMELFRLFPKARQTFTVATAARMSASFPYFSPGVSLPTVPRRRVVDAGYYDNYGVSLAASWLFSGSNEKWMDRHFKRILLIQIRDGTTEETRQLLTQEADGSSFWRRTLEELTTPLEGLYNARTSSSSFRNDGQLELLDKFKRQQRARGSTPPSRDPRTSKFLVVNLEYGGPASLSWYLSEREKEDIQSKAIDLTKRPKWRDLRRWWDYREPESAGPPD